jgi:hypothetical protein
MIYYHGSIVGGLKILKPFSSEYSNIKEPKVYLTTNKQLATHYIWNSNMFPLKMPMLKICEDGVLIFQEMFSDALALFYKGLSGYLYICEGDYKTSKESGIMTCVTSDEPVPIKDAEYIDNVYEEILRYKNNGKFIYEHYEDLPQWRHDIIRGHVMRGIKQNNLINNPMHPYYKLYQEKWPQYWKEAIVLYENNLL